MNEGAIEIICTTPKAGTPLERRDEVVAIEGEGLEGDRYRDAEGTFSDRPGSGRHVTLIEAEAIEAIAKEDGIVIDPTEARRNLVTRGVALNHLVDREFTVGDVVLRGTRLCEPCGHLTKLTGHPMTTALLHRAGLRADIVSGGVIRVGDPVRW